MNIINYKMKRGTLKDTMLAILLLMGASLVVTACGDDDDIKVPDIKPTATGTMTDNDGNEYKWVRIGNLDWMAESFRGGESWIGQDYVTENGLIYTLYADNDEIAEERIQRLGNYYTYQQALDLCPEGWRLPSDEDWKQLEMTLGMSKSEADKTGWRNGAAQLLTQGTEGTGLNFGYAGQLATFFTASIEEYHVGDYGYFWSSTINTDVDSPCAFIRKISPAVPNKVERSATDMKYRYLSVRYCRDAR